MDQQANGQPRAAFAIPRWEFIAICAGLMATNALAIDIMLPGLQQIGASLGVENENHRQYVISAYFVGMAGALLFYGPISDRFGRRPPLMFGLAVYILAAVGAAFAPSFETLLALRALQGVGAAWLMTTLNPTPQMVTQDLGTVYGNYSQMLDSYAARAPAMSGSLAALTRRAMEALRDCAVASRSFAMAANSSAARASK